jgi:ubiquinol-cytochrome c reductase cytochrome c subunit
VMPRFGERQLDDTELASVTRYVLSTRDPDDRGGWGIGHLGPIPEGMVTWLLGLAAIVLAIRIIGERTTE